MAPSGFWNFAVAGYGRDGVSSACLALQESTGADVNVVLFCVWLASGGQSLSPILGEVLAISRRWQAVIAPLRQARRELKALQDENAARTLRDRVKAAELDAERCECEALAGLAAVPDATRSHCRAEALENLRVYFSAMNFAIDPLGDGDILRIVDTLCAA